MKNLLLFLIFILFIACKEEEINNRLKACFTFNNQMEISMGDTVQFSDCSQKATSYHWDFGDGDTSNLPMPFHVFADTGTYQVFLRTWNETEADSITRAIVIRQGNSKPITGFHDSANYTPEYPAYYKTLVGIPVKFCNSSKYATQYLWEFGDGSSVDTRDPVHVFMKEGTYKVILHSINEYGEDTISTIIKVGAFRIGTRSESPGSSTCYFDFDQDSVYDLKIDTYMHWHSMMGPFQCFISFIPLNGFEVLVSSYVDTTWRAFDTTIVYYYDSVLVPRKFTTMEFASINDRYFPDSIPLLYTLGITSSEWGRYSGINRDYWRPWEEGFVVFRKLVGNEKILVWIYIRIQDGSHMYIKNYKLFRDVDEVLIKDQ
jgi:hypothetical protein